LFHELIDGIEGHAQALLDVFIAGDLANARDIIGASAERDKRKIGAAVLDEVRSSKRGMEQSKCCIRHLIKQAWRTVRKKAGKNEDAWNG